MTCATCNDAGLVSTSLGSPFKKLCPDCCGTSHKHEMLRDPAPIVGLPDQGGPLIPPSYLDAAERARFEQDYQWLVDAAKALVERQQTVHQRVACPTCLAPIGARCTRAKTARLKYASTTAYDPTRKPLKHSHNARIQADGIPLR